MHDPNQESRDVKGPEAYCGEDVMDEGSAEWIVLELECDQQLEDLSMVCQTLMVNFDFGSAA